MEEKATQILSLENRSKLSVSGVDRVENFNDEIVVLATNKGKLTIKGNGLSISKLNVEEGKLTVNGSMNSFAYSENSSKKDEGGFIKKLFK